LPTFADIAFPTAVQKPFTYKIPAELQANLVPGVRVWVPLRKQTAIGMVVRLHNNKPEFKTRNIRKQLDAEPVLTPEILELTEWVHRFYYAGWGEVIQAALPAGLNFQAKEVLIPKIKKQMLLTSLQQEMVEAVKDSGWMVLEEADKRWSDKKEQKQLKSLINNRILEVWEQPVQKVEPKTVKVWDWKDGEAPGQAQKLIKQYHKEGKSYKWICALDKLRKLNLPLPQAILTDREQFNHYTLNRIADEGLIDSSEIPSYQVKPQLEFAPEKIRILNNHQQACYQTLRKAVDAGQFAPFLLFGVTGSGKTEVYIHALKYALEQDRGGLILVPEIALTPQTVKRFYQIFGNKIAVLHSRMNDRERFDSWLALRKGEKSVAIGPRSAVFAPVHNIGLIVVDEEHDASYKQVNPAPRYHARDVAIMRARFNDAVVVMGSATPSMVSYHRAGIGKYELLKLPARHAGATLPEVKVIDLKQYRYAMKGPLAVPLYQKTKQVLKRGEQAILLYNRRGYASYQLCKACGHIQECPNCSVSLTLHKKFGQLRCHYCGYATRMLQECEACGSTEMEHKGSGTQQIEEEIEQLFPQGRILRMDQDTTAGKGAHNRILTAFGEGEYDILVGTQLVAKGLDFPNVTLVGVVNADTELAFPSFASGERMFQLLSQVAGRSGRAEKPGVVYLQTWQPDHDAIVYAQKHDYRGFARKEVTFRKDRYYPPYSRLVRYLFKGKNMQFTGKVAEIYTESVRRVAKTLPVLGPSPAAIPRMQRYCRWECFLKLPLYFGTSDIEKLLDSIQNDYQHKKPPNASRIRINIHVDAIT